MASIAFLLSYWQIIIALMLAVVAMGAAAWFFKNWKVAAGAVVLLAVYFGGQGLWTAGYKTRVAEDVAAQTKVLRDRIETMNKVAEDDAKRAAEDANKIAELEAKVNETPANSGACLDIDSARRVRDVR